MLDFSKFDVLTFDCYGTLVDWEAGILSALKPILSAHGISLRDEQLIELYGEFEAEAEAGEYRAYREVLQSVVRSVGKRLSFTPTMAEAESLSLSVPRWRPWPDTTRALKKLATRYRLAIISNIDDDLFNATLPHLNVNFKSVTTAEQSRCYKPGLEIFHMALGKVGAVPDRVLHVGQSIYHDVLPAQSLGMSTVWVNRPSCRSGIGAVKQAEGTPDLEVHDLETLATMAVG
jgi:2-haloacid dehalogenase